MKKMKWLGLLLVALGLCILGYQGIESIMSEAAFFKNYTLVDMFGKNVFSWHHRIPTDAATNGINYVINMPAYMLSLILGGIFLIIHGLFARD